MEERFKEHIANLVRYQTSVGRDLESGLRLDRNEKVTNFSPEVFQQVMSCIRPYDLNASPDSAALYEKIAASVRVPQSMIYVTAGITEGSRFLYESLTNPGENVIVLDPTYPMYQVYAKYFRLEYRRFSYGSDHRPDWSTLFSQIDKKTAFVIVANPNLPIESAFGVDDIRKIAQICRDNGTILVVDEAYHFFGAQTSLELLNDFNNLVLMRTFSKAYGLPGIRLGFMISQPKNIAYLSKTRSLVESNAMSMKVAEYLLDHPQIKEDNVRDVKEGGEYVRSELTRLKLCWHGGVVTNGIMIFLRTPQQTKDAMAYLRERKVYIRGAFEPPYDACVRVSIGARRAMERFIKEFEPWVRKNLA